MIYKSLTFLSLLSTITSNKINTDTTTIKTTTTKTTNDIKEHKLTIHSTNEEFKSYFQNQIMISGTFHDKIEKLNKLKVDSIKHEKKIDLNLLNEESNSNLRGLKMKNNFLTFTVYGDSACTDFQYQVGQLVNYCTNQVGEETGVKKSSIYKVNKKENLVVQLDYEGHNCKGIPTKVSSINSAYDFEALDECSSTELDGEIAYLTVGYISTYPTFDKPGYYVETTYPEDLCTSENKDYQSYAQFPIEMLGIPLNECIPVDTLWAVYSTSNCASNGHLTANIYTDAACSEYATTVDIFDTDCLNDDDGDGDDDDDDDDGDDDDDYVDTGVINNAFCT